MSVRNYEFHQRLMELDGGLDKVYKAISDMDMSAAVLAALNTMQYKPDAKTIVKNPHQSTLYRNEGNNFLNAGLYQNALICYNKALLHAPGQSNELTQAYHNRSVLLFKVSEYTAALTDIQTCLLLRCTGDLEKKLKNRKDKCLAKISREKAKTNMLIQGFPMNFFKFNVRRHPNIPCLSDAVDVISESGEMKAVAAKDIHVGTLVAIERAFMTHSCMDKAYWSCHCCQSVSFNLIPCDNCCFVLFCSDKCKSLCLKEYHSVECQIMKDLESLDNSHKFRITFKAVLKMKTLCKQWSTLIKESKNIGRTRLKTSSLNEIYNVDNYSSILSFKGSRHFVCGPMYNACFKYATVINFLTRIPDFFPESSAECYEAKKCLATLFMTLELYWPHYTEIENAGEEIREDKFAARVPHHYGLFSFTSKLKHSCDPNLIVLGLNNRVALMAVKPIERNTELTISYVGHWYEHMHRTKRPIIMYLATLSICNCIVCTMSWDSHNFNKSNLNEQQKIAYRAWDQNRQDEKLPQGDPSHFRESCKLLECLDAHTKEHFRLFTELRSQLRLCQYAAILNPWIFD